MSISSSSPHLAIPLRPHPPTTPAAAISARSSLCTSPLLRPYRAATVPSRIGFIPTESAFFFVDRIRASCSSCPAKRTQTAGVLTARTPAATASPARGARATASCRTRVEAHHSGCADGRSNPASRTNDGGANRVDTRCGGLAGAWSSGDSLSQAARGSSGGGLGQHLRCSLLWNR